jgi:hypothetical protein
MTGQHKQKRQFVRVSVIMFCIPTLLFSSCSTEDPRVSPEHKLSKQEIMRLAEDVAAGRREASELTNHGITVGDWIEIDKEGFLKLIENQNDKQDSLVFIVLYRDDFPFNDPSEIEEALVEEPSKDAVG